MDRFAVSISIIIASYNSENTILSCLDALAPQVEQEPSCEVIVVDSSSDGTPDLIAARQPWVRLLVHPERIYPGEARNLGIAHAKGDILAFVDADCVVGERWLAEILAAHKTAEPVIGGAVDNANPGNYVGWGYYFGEFSRWAPQIPAGPMMEIPACSLSLKRWVFDRYGPFMEGMFCEDTAFHRRMVRDGCYPVFNPKIKVSHINPDSLFQFLSHEVEHGRAFASFRVSEGRFTDLKRLIYGLGSPILPLLLLGRVTQRVVANKIYLSKFVGALPVVMVGLIAWSLGEMSGYLFPVQPAIRDVMQLIQGP